MVDWRNEFTKWWINEFKTIKFPPDVYKGTAQVFSYFVDQETKKFRPWSDLVHKFELDYDVPLQVIYFIFIVFSLSAYVKFQFIDC